MNPDDRLGEATKQIGHAADDDLSDDYVERMLDNATQLVERSRRRLARRRQAREGEEVSEA